MTLLLQCRGFHELKPKVFCLLDANCTKFWFGWVIELAIWTQLIPHDYNHKLQISRNDSREIASAILNHTTINTHVTFTKHNLLRHRYFCINECGGLATAKIGKCYLCVYGKSPRWSLAWYINVNQSPLWNWSPMYIKWHKTKCVAGLLLKTSLTYICVNVKNCRTNIDGLAHDAGLIYVYMSRPSPVDASYIIVSQSSVNI